MDALEFVDHLDEVLDSPVSSLRSLSMSALLRKTVCASKVGDLGRNQAGDALPRADLNDSALCGAPPDAALPHYCAVTLHWPAETLHYCAVTLHYCVETPH